MPPSQIWLSLGISTGLPTSPKQNHSREFALAHRDLSLVQFGTVKLIPSLYYRLRRGTILRHRIHFTSGRLRKLLNCLPSEYLKN